MSRVYSAMTGASVARPGDPPGPTADEPVVVAAPFVEAADAPFVEIGGPGGPVFSAGASTVTPPPRQKLEGVGAAAREYPRIAPPAPRLAAPDAVPAARDAQTPPPAYLSVHFHDTAPILPLRPATGPDLGLVALFAPDHPVAGEYRTLRDEISRQLPASTSRVLFLTAAAPEAGTTTVLANLGITLARDGNRVLVLDANLTRPGVAAKLALRNSPGLAEVLGQNLPLPWALQPGPVTNLQALTTGAPADATSAALGRDLPKLLLQLRQWFDWILIDGGVWGVTPDRDATCPAADAVYLVTRDAEAGKPEFTGLRAWVKELGGALRGYITTRL